MKRFVQWILSRLFPYHTIECEKFKTDSQWDRQKQVESEQFYGGHDGTGRI
jgi:hypothetical protein